MLIRAAPHKPEIIPVSQNLLVVVDPILKRRKKKHIKQIPVWSPSVAAAGEIEPDLNHIALSANCTVKKVLANFVEKQSFS